MKNFRRFHAMALVAATLLGYGALAPAQNTNSKIKDTRHNLSASNNIAGAVKATSEDQICVFCHTPHAANTSAPAPLWNRKIGGNTSDDFNYNVTYKPYGSNSLDAAAMEVTIINGVKTLPQPGGTSKLCLSCHDGSIALGTVGVLDGKGNPATIAGLAGTMPGGSQGADTGFTRNLGVDLRNDHPISFTFDATLATSDGEFRSPPYKVSTTTVVGKRSAGVKPMLPLDHEGKVQCTTCHDPHLQASKFLRLNRLQKGAPTGLDFNATNDQICLGCHNKLGKTWANSAHADSTVADEAYLSAAAALRDFPAGTKVWEAACLNCHDTHTVQGSRRLLREGVEGTVAGSNDGSYMRGTAPDDLTSVSAIENTCYQCHQGAATKIIGTVAGSSVPDIRSAFESTIRMPIKTADQGVAGSRRERHDIGNADFMETPEQLGSANHANRHVECTDCHNPHRVMRSNVFYGAPNANRTHTAGGTSGKLGADGNVASGVLRGTWGVEPTYGTVTTWPKLPTYTVKKGDPGDNTDTATGMPYLTREYQLCFKCHSDYGGTSGGKMPVLGYTGGTVAGTMGLNNYTNVASEFAVNATDTPSSLKDQGELNNAGIEPSVKNHRSWHPVLMPTGRTGSERMAYSTERTFSNIRAPFATPANIGYQTMHCSDCHGTNATGLNQPAVQGPHGSANNFVLKGVWSNAVTPGGIDTDNTNNYLCGRCHNPANTTSGFGPGSDANHNFEAKVKTSCTSCHIAIPHGWKNKAFLVNLACVQKEGGDTYTDTCTNLTGSDRKTIEPYYYRALLRIKTWQASSQWSKDSCGSGSDSEEWMSSACENGGT